MDELSKFMDNLVGDEGLRTDVQVKLANETIIKSSVALGMALVFGITIGIVVGNKLSGR